MCAICHRLVNGHLKATLTKDSEALDGIAVSGLRVTGENMALDEAASGFFPLFGSSSFADLIGPLFYKKYPDGMTIGLRVCERHLNSRGTVHGGLLSAVADIALGYNAAGLPTRLTPLVTAGQTIAITGFAREGDWLEFHVDVHKRGKQLVFATCFATSNDVSILRASGIYSIVGKEIPYLDS